MYLSKEKHKLTKIENAFIRILNATLALQHNETLTPVENYFLIFMIRHKDTYVRLLTNNKNKTDIVIQKGNISKYSSKLLEKNIIHKKGYKYVVNENYLAIYTLLDKFGMDGINLKITHDKLNESKFHFNSKIVN